MEDSKSTLKEWDLGFGIKALIDADRRAVRFAFGSPARATAGQLMRLASNIADLRQSLAPPVPVNPPTPSSMRVAPHDTAWAEIDPTRGYVICALRDGGFGWLYYGLPPAAARRFAATLIAQADRLDAVRMRAGPPH